MYNLFLQDQDSWLYTTSTDSLGTLLILNHSTNMQAFLNMINKQKKAFYLSDQIAPLR